MNLEIMVQYNSQKKNSRTREKLLETSEQQYSNHVSDFKKNTDFRNINHFLSQSTFHFFHETRYGKKTIHFLDHSLK